MSKFEPGDLVRLKSGGPLMTVCALEDAGKNGQRVECMWWLAGSPSRCAEYFPECVLEHVLEKVGLGDVASDPEERLDMEERARLADLNFRQGYEQAKRELLPEAAPKK